jgi:hypothetical protein
LVYGYVPRTYLPHTSVGGFEILRLREPGEPVAVDYWRLKLGSMLDLGALPSASRSATAARPCDAEPCVPLLEVTTAPDWPGGRIDVPIKVAAREFTVALQAAAGEGVHAIRLDRVWFWTLPTEPGPRTHIARRPPPAGVGWKLERVGGLESYLY